MLFISMDLFLSFFFPAVSSFPAAILVPGFGVYFVWGCWAALALFSLMNVGEFGHESSLKTFGSSFLWP